MNIGGANIEIGGTSNGQVVEYVNSRNPRGWSCLHVTEGGITSDFCTNATVSNNDIGPCGQSGTNSAGDGLWADGISFACTDSLVEGNDVSLIFIFHGVFGSSSLILVCHLDYRIYRWWHCAFWCSGHDSYRKYPHLIFDLFRIWSHQHG
jgi:hypothetical protein